MAKETALKIKDHVIQKVISSSEKSDKWNVAAKTIAVKHFPYETLVKGLASKPNIQLISSLALQLRDSSEAIVKTLETISALKSNNEIFIAVLNQFNQSPRLLQDPLIGQLLSKIKSNDLRVLAALTKMSNRFGIPPTEQFLSVSKEALIKILDPSSTEKEKLGLMEIIQLIPYAQKSNTLFYCLKNNVQLSVQEEALRQLSTYREKEIGIKLIDMWNEMSPSTRRYASDLLLYVEVHHDALLTALENGKIQIGEMNFDLERRRMLIAWDDNPVIRKRAAKLFSDEEIISRKEAVEKMRPALSLKGNPHEGEKVFQAICSNCHRYGNNGKDVGPVLTEINRKSKESIMHDILDPNAAVNTQYISHRIETKNGIIHIGVIDAESDQSVVMKKMGGEKITFDKKDIAKMTSLGKSLMMEGLEGSMTHQQMADLLSYLQNN